MSYFEVIEHLRAGRAAGADVSARVLDDYYTHTFIGQAFINRLALLSRQLVDEVARCRTAIAQPLHLISMQYIGGDELLPLARDARMLADLEVTSLDSSVDAVRHAEQKLRPAFGSQIRFVKADPVQWLGGPACPADSACVVYDVSLVERLPAKRTVQVLGDIHRALRTGGMLLLGSTAGSVPVAEQMIRDWLLGWDWKYRSESEWRQLFAQTPFGADRLSFEYESLGINALIRLEKAG